MWSRAARSTAARWRSSAASWVTRMAASRERPRSWCGSSTRSRTMSRRRDRHRRHRRLHAGRRSGRVSRGRGAGAVGRCPDLHALTRHRRARAGDARRRRRGARARRGDDRRAHALLPHQLDVGASHRPGAGAGGALPVGRRARHHRGVPVRVGFDRDRCRVPRSRADPRTIPGPDLRSPTSRPENGSPTTRACASCARPTREEWSSPSSSTKPTRVDLAVLRRSLTFPDAIVASDAMPPLWTDTAGRLTTGRCRRSGHPPAAPSHALRLWREEGTPLIEAIRRATLLPAAVLEGSVRDAQEGASTSRRRRRPRGVRRRASPIRPPTLDAPVVGHRPRVGRRDVRRSRRRARAGRTSRHAGQRTSTVTRATALAQ